MGPEVEFQDERIAAVTGAEFEIDRRRARAAAERAVRRSPRGPCSASGRGVAARARTWRSPAGSRRLPVLGSRATHLPSEMGGLNGRPLRAGDRPAAGKKGSGVFSAVARPDREKTPDPFSAGRAGDCSGPARPARRPLRARRAGRAAVGPLRSGRERPIAWDSVCMAPRLRHAGDAEMLSDATPLGALQVPAAGEPILLMADRQTTGGYPSLATVISADIRPGRAARAGRFDRVRRLIAARSDGGADRPGAGADGIRGRPTRMSDSDDLARLTR